MTKPTVYIRRRITPLLLSGLIALQLTGCALEPLQAPRASAANSAKLNSASIAPAALGAFKLDDQLDKKLDQSIMIRAGLLVPPAGGSFSQYLADTLKVELEGVRLYDPKAATTIAGSITRNEVDIAPFSPGRATLGARFVLTRQGATRFNREVTVEASWDNAFAGAVAFSVARGQYEVMYRKLVGALFSDPEFIRAMSKE